MLLRKWSQDSVDLFFLQGLTRGKNQHLNRQLVAANRAASVLRKACFTQAFFLNKFICSIKNFFIATGYLSVALITSICRLGGFSGDNNIVYIQARAYFETVVYRIEMQTRCIDDF